MHTPLTAGCCSEKVAQPGEVRAFFAHLRRGTGIGLREQRDGGGEQRLLAFGEETVVGKLDSWCYYFSTSRTFTK